MRSGRYGRDPSVSPERHDDLMKRFISRINERRGGRRTLLLLAAGLHITVTAGVFVIGRFGLMPTQFDGNGLGQFAFDSFVYQDDIVGLTDKLSSQGVVPWLKAVAPLHIKLYAFSHALFSHWTAPNVLTIEPLNLFYYLAVLCLIYKLGEKLFDRRTAVLAALLVALWPSFLLHTTQPLRDPLLTVAVLLFVYVTTCWLTEDFTYRQGMLALVPAALAVLTIWIVRLAMWDVVLAVTLLGAVLLVIRLLRERRLLRGNILSVLLLSGVILLIPQFKPILQMLQKREAGKGSPLIAEQVYDLPIWERVARRRQGFADLKKDEHSSAASNVDEDVKFSSTADIVRYVPRALEIGFLAPFPNMWFEDGSQVGLTGRLLSGFETLCMYLLELLSLLSLWRLRKKLAVWLWLGTVIFGVTALGLIVLNIGAFYRLRYPYHMLIVVLGTAGATQLLRSRANRGLTTNP
jgi:hypothetical protein